VKVIGLENGKISLSAKQIKEDPWTAIPRKVKQGDIIDGEVIRFVPYGVFVRVFDDINGLIHLSELSQQSINNPNEIVKLGSNRESEGYPAWISEKRKIGLSIKALQMSDGGDAQNEKAPPAVKKAPAKKEKEAEATE
jgi:small subunit ribosomal protein S1